MHTNSTRRIIAVTAAAIFVSAAWATPAPATTDHGGAGGSTVWTEPDPGQLIGQRKARAAHDFVAYAAARAQHAAHERRSTRLFETP